MRDVTIIRCLYTNVNENEKNISENIDIMALLFLAYIYDSKVDFIDTFVHLILNY